MTESDEARVAARSLVTRVDELEKQRAARRDEVGLASVGVALGVAVVVLSAMSWARSRDGVTTTLWGLAEGGGWQGTVTVLLTVLVGLWSVVASMQATPNVVGLRVLTGLTVLTAAAFAAVGTIMPTGDDGDHASEPARWIALAAAIGLVLAHAARLGQLRDLGAGPDGRPSPGAARDRD